MVIYSCTPNIRVIYLIIYHYWEDGKPMLYSNIYVMHYIKDFLKSLVEFVPPNFLFIDDHHVMLYLLLHGCTKAISEIACLYTCIAYSLLFNVTII